MHNSLTQVLFKIYSRAFYRDHAGLFLMLLLIFVAPGGDFVKFHEAIMLYLVVKPFALMLAFLVGLVYFLRCIQFTYVVIDLEQNRFLYYSLNSFTRSKQLWAWSVVQVSMAMPVLFYFGCCLLLSITHGHFLSAFFMIVYLVVMILATAYVCTWKMNRLIRNEGYALLSKLTKQWKKPLHLLFIFHIFKALKWKYLLIKGLSYGSVMLIFLLFSGSTTDIRIPSIGVLAVAVAHSLLIFEEYKFRDFYLRFARTLPYSRVSIFFSQLVMLSVLLLPESVWLLLNLPIATACLLFLFCLSICCLLSCTLYLVGLNQEQFLKIVFGIFVLSFVVVLYKFLVPLVLLNFLLSFVIFFFNYYKFRTGTLASDKE